MTNRWRKFLSLPSSERRFLVRAWFLLPTMAIALRLLGLKRCLSLLKRFSPTDRQSPSPNQSTIQRAENMARLVKIAARYSLSPGTCLQQSVTVWWLLKREDISSELRIGVSKPGDTFKAHAWIEIQGHVVNDPDRLVADYVAFDRIINSVEAACL